jgi:putative inorganic carbon (HCO3(-)) transporter
MLIALLTLIFIRPFISSPAFPYANLTYSFLLLVFLSIWIFKRGIAINEIGKIKYPLGLFALAIFISLFFSLDKLNSAKELYKYLGGILLFLLTASLSPKDKSRLIICILSAAFLVSVLAVYQYFFGFRHLLDYMHRQGITDFSALDYIARRRAFSPFITANILASYIAMVIPLAMAQKKSVWLILPLFFALLLTKSLGATICLFLAVGVYFYLCGSFKTKHALLLAGVLIIIGFVFNATRSATQKEYVKISFSTEMRMNYWRDTLDTIKAHPLTGVGLGNFNLAHSRYAHNTYLQIWAEMGLLGIIGFFWFITTVIKSALLKLKSLPAKNYLAGLIAANTVFLLNSLVDFSFFLPEISLIWWCIAGLGISLGLQRVNAFGS